MKSQECADLKLFIDSANIEEYVRQPRWES